jgi:hypothetical protein
MPEGKVFTMGTDESELINTIRAAKKEKFASINVEIHQGEIVKIHWTHKVDLERFRRLKENAQQI